MLCVYAALRGVENAVPERKDRGVDEQLKMGQKTAEKTLRMQLPLLRKAEKPPVRKGIFGQQGAERGHFPVALFFGGKSEKKRQAAEETGQGEPLNEGFILAEGLVLPDEKAPVALGAKGSEQTMKRGRAR